MAGYDVGEIWLYNNGKKSMINTTTDFFSLVSGKVKEAMQVHVEKEFDLMKSKMLNDLESRKNEICAGIMIDLTKSVDFERMGHTVTIRIKEIPKQ